MGGSSAYAKFVKANYQRAAKQCRDGSSARVVMSKVGEMWRASKEQHGGGSDRQSPQTRQRRERHVAATRQVMGVFQERDRVVRDTAAGERRGLLDQLQNHARRIHELNGQMSEIGQRLVRLTSELANLGNGVAPDALEQQIAEVNSEFERAGNTLMMLTRAMARVNGRVRAIDSEEATRLRQLRQRRQRWQLDDRRKARSRESAMEHEERARAAREREAAAGGDVDEEAKEAE